MIVVLDTDDLILATALSAQADYLVTGDKGLLGLGSFEDIPIVKVADFLKVVSRQGKDRAP